MAGYVLYNGFWNPQGPTDTVRRLVEAGCRRGADWSARPNTSFAAGMDGAPYVEKVEGGRLDSGDYALFWDKDVRLARAMEAVGMRLYNTADAVSLCDDKAATHLALSGKGIPMPRTLVAPMAYVETGEPLRAFLEYGARVLGFPLVVKECFGSLGGQVYLAAGWERLWELASRMGPRPFLLQEFVAASAGRDARLYVVGDRVVAAMRRRSDTDFRANIGQGGSGEAYTPTPQEERLALVCCRELGLAVAGVDLLWDAQGAPLVCEVNSNAQVTAITACTGVDVADAVAAYVLGREQAGRG